MQNTLTLALSLRACEEIEKSEMRRAWVFVGELKTGSFHVFSGTNGTLVGKTTSGTPKSSQALWE